MSGDRVIVFVDGLPYAERSHLNSIQRFLKWNRPLQPGFGYSVNVKAELFAGARPDEAGFLNEWSYRAGQGYRWLRVPRPVWALLSKSRAVRRGISKVLSFLANEDLRNIPLPLLHSLVRTGVNAYERTFPGDTLLSRNALQRYLHTELGGDGKACAALCGDVRNTGAEPVRAFLALAELDHIFHRDGKDSPAYTDYIAWLDEQLETIWELLVKRANSPGLCVVSDHGMAPVERAVTFELEEAVSGVGSRYGYFVDATMARVWVSESSALSEIRSWLDGSGMPGRCLDAEERKQWAISSNEFGDLIFLLDEGVTFAPNFFGDRPCRAMHGYWPSLESQQGLIASSVELGNGRSGEPLPAIAAHRAMGRFASGE